MNNDVENQQGQLYIVGSRGYSAYEVAVQNGFVGTEEEWLESLKGEKGDPGTPFGDLTPEQKEELRGEEGKSAYEVAVENGYQGTEEDWVNDFLTPDNYYDKDEIDSKMNTNVEFIFNSQKNINDSYYFETSDETPVYDKYYFIKDSDDFYRNGYCVMTHLTEFENGVTYYEENENANRIAGECLIIKAFGKTIMLDTGGDNRSEPIKKYLQDHNVTKIDYLILSHYHYDHCTNLANMVDYLDFSDCKCYFPRVAPILPGSQHQALINNFINTTGVEVTYPDELDSIDIGELKITFYNCGQQAFSEIQELYGEDEQKINDYSMLALFTYRNTNVLYSGDIEYIAQERLYNKGFFNDMKIDLYKYHHHGVNLIDNCYVPFLTTLDPKNVVILSNTTAVDIHSDKKVLNLRKENTAFDTDKIYISNGYCVSLKKGTEYEIEFKNTHLYSNGFELNNYCHILTIKNESIYKLHNMLFVLNDVQADLYRCLFRIGFRVDSSSFDLNKVYIENISSTGARKIIDDIYVGFKDNTFNLYLKKTFENQTPTLTLLSKEHYNDLVKFEYGSENLTEEEFATRYGNDYVKGYFSQELTLSSAFTTYPSAQPLTWYKQGSLVELTGIITNVNTISSGSGELICILPTEIVPKSAFIYTVQQSTDRYLWCARIMYNTEDQRWELRFGRFGTSSFEQCPANTWLPIHMTYFARY